ncbi:uncharacterized protein LOC135161262 isoform X2 [Diachasmimorpha longicaudata]|uniref:uncharacterized protein LOC135161262 isoform X2 n=1 Tax=Diachasmimorpha longicaudata TaxID=58733 RepID=UPI0030B89F2C
MNPEKIIPSFNVFASYVFVALSHLKIFKNTHSSWTTRIIDTCITTSLLTATFLLIVSEAIDVQNSYDLPSFAARFNPLLFHLLGFVKWTYCLTHHAEIEQLIISVELCHAMGQKIDRTDKDKDRYRMKMEKFQKSSTMFVNLWLLVCVFGVVQWCMNPIIYDLYNDLYGERSMNSTFDRHLPYPGCFPWKMKSLSIYIIYFTFQFVGGIGAGIGIGAYNILSITFIIYSCIHLEYLSETLSISEDRISSREIARKENAFDNKLKHCVQHHNQILEVFARTTTITSFPMLVQCLDTIINLCLVSLEASTTEINGIQISDAFYHCNWEQYIGTHESSALRTNKMVTIGIMNAQKPLEIIAGPFCVLSLETFRALTSMSLSNALILRQLSNQD